MWDLTFVFALIFLNLHGLVDIRYMQLSGDDVQWPQGKHCLKSQVYTNTLTWPKLHIDFQLRDMVVYVQNRAENMKMMKKDKRHVLI